MYILMFLAGVTLRYKKKDVERHYHVPGGNLGMIVVASLGLISCLIAIIVGFFPPNEIAKDQIWKFELFLIGGVILLTALPQLIYKKQH
jgi:amino acid transporter